MTACDISGLGAGAFGLRTAVLVAMFEGVDCELRVGRRSNRMNKRGTAKQQVSEMKSCTL